MRQISDIELKLIKSKSNLILINEVIIYTIFTSFAICKIFRAFKILFLTITQNQLLNGTPDYTLNYFLEPESIEF